MADQQNPFEHLNVPDAPQTQAQPTDRGVVIVNPAVRQEQRAEQSQAMEAQRLGLSEAGEMRATREETRRTLEGLRKEYRGLPAVKDYENAIPNYAAGLKTEPNGSGDLALVYYFAKTIDPGSAVQQGEMANIQSTDARLPAFAQTALRELRASDGVFTDTAREGLRRELHNIIVQRNLSYKAARDQYRQLASSPDYDVNPDSVVGQHSGAPFFEGVKEYFAAQKAAEEEAEQRVSGTEETFLTAEDRELQGRLDSAYNAGASLEELQAISGEYGRSLPISTQEALSEARLQGRGINVEPTGRNDQTSISEALGVDVPLVGETTVGTVAESPVGAYFIQTANALLSGGMDEIGGALGLEADVIQAAKENLRERYPVSSFAGDVSGQALQFALTRRLGLPPQYQPAAEVIQGAGYGFGEANEDRLTGAAFGAGGAVVGQQIAQRLVEPGVQAIIQRIARDTGAPREAVEQAIGEAFGPPAPPRGGGAQVPAGAPPALPSPSQLNQPRVPTSEEMGRFSRIEEVPLENARRGQNVFAWEDFNQGRYAEPLIDGYGQTRPVAVKLENGEYIIYDGNHRASLAASQGQTSMEMDVIDARYFDPENMGRRPAPSRAGEMSDQELLTELGATPSPAPRAPSVAEQQGISEEMVELARRASGRGPGSSAARAELREAIEADPTLIQQSEDLGLELPADVFSANVQLKNLTGLARSQPGSAAEAGWQQTVSNSARQVEESLTEMGASRDLAGLSDDVFTRLNSNMESLQRQGDELREAVNANLNMQSRVEATNLEDALAQTISDLGGIDEATQAMTSQERKLLKALGVGEAPKQPTYAYMDRLRREIGDALNNGAGPWADTERVTLQRYYNALADDRIAHVARDLGQDAADDLAASNRIFQAMYAAREEMTNLFGRDLDKGIGAQIRSVIAQGARGDTTNLRRLMAVIPEDMRAEVAFSGILANARSRGAEGGFSFPNFRNTYRAIRENAPVYRELARNMTESQRNFLDNLYGVSQGIADAQSRIISTGRARGGPAAEINAQSLTQKIVEQATRRGVGAGTGMLGGSLLGDVTLGIPAAVALESGLAYLGKGGASNLDRVSDVIGSAPYRDLVNEAARGGNMTRAINRLANSKPFGLFARGLGLNTQEARRAWISSALAVGATRQVEGEPEQAGPQAITVQ